MRIWLVNAFEAPPTSGFRLSRVRGLAEELSQRGHHIVLWTTDFFHFGKHHWSRSDHEQGKKLPFELRAVPVSRYQRNVSAKRFLSHLSFGYRLSRCMNQEPGAPDVVFSAMPPIEATAAAVAFCRRHSIPSCVDVADIWPDSFSLLVPPLLRPWLRTCSRPHRALVAYALNRCSAITTISQTYLNWSQDFRVKPIDRSGIFPWAALPPPQAPRRDAPQQPFVATFCGSLGATYDFGIVLRAAALLESRFPGQFRIVIAGNGPRRREIERECQSANVTIMGAQMAEALDTLLCGSDVGICSYRTDAPQSLPMKLGTYAAYGLPIVNTLRGEMKALIDRFGIGVTVSNEIELADVLQTWRQQPSRWKACAAASREYAERIEHRKISQELADFVEGLADTAA